MQQILLAIVFLLTIIRGDRYTVTEDRNIYNTINSGIEPDCQRIFGVFQIVVLSQKSTELESQLKFASRSYGKLLRRSRPLNETQRVITGKGIRGMRANRVWKRCVKLVEELKDELLSKGHMDHVLTEKLRNDKFAVKLGWDDNYVSFFIKVKNGRSEKRYARYRFGRKELEKFDERRLPPDYRSHFLG
eukprot:199902_1